MINTKVTVEAKATPALSAADLVDEITVSMIILGLGTNEEVKMVRHAILHGSRTVVDALKELKNADQQIKSDEIAATPGTAMAAKTGRPPKKANEWQPYFCKEHGPNKSHAMRDCKKLNGGQKAAKVAEGEDKKAHIAKTAHLACPPPKRLQNQKADIIWNADSGATSHMTPHKKWIRNMKPCKIPIKLANDEIVYAEGIGSVIFNPRNYESIRFSQVLYVPSLSNNLFSIVSAVLDAKLRVVIENDELNFSKDGETLFKGMIKGKTAMLDGDTLENTEHAFIMAVNKDLWHQRLGHIGNGRLETLASKNLATGMLFKRGSKVIDTCEHCIAGKQHRDPFPNLASNRATEILERIHTDVHGPLPKTLSGYRYWIVFVDDAGRMKHAVPLKAKTMHVKQLRGTSQSWRSRPENESRSSETTKGEST